MNFFSSDAFLASLARSAFPDRRDIGPAWFEVSGTGERFRMLEVDGRPVHRFPFLDFVEAGAPPADAPVRRTRWIAWTARESVPAGEYTRTRLPERAAPSPSIDWRLFPSWESFASRASNSAETRRKWRKLEKDEGPLRFHAETDDVQVWSACRAWKSAQYRASGLADLFARPDVDCLFDELRARRALVVSALFAGDRLVAAHAGARYAGRFYYWVPAYDPALVRAAPGKFLLHALMEDSFRRGDREFDFLLGDEAYKLQYATHVRVVGAAGTPPLSTRLPRALRSAAKRVLAYAPSLEARLRAIRRRGTQPLASGN